MPVHVINEANRCLQCKNPRCHMQGCPIQTNIPEVIRLFKENRMMDAAEILFENNPLSVVCSLVCNHEGQCEGHCVRGIKGEPVYFSSIENYISDSCFERLDLSCAPSNGMKVGVVGAGNAAMDVARTAIRHGSRDVTVYVRGDKVAASENEYNYAVLDGVHFEFRKNIVRIVDEGAVFCDRVEDPATGKFVDDHSTDQLVEADSVMISISQVPRDRLVNRDHELHLNQRGTLQIDDQGETTMDGVFASGDVVTGAKTVVAAVAAAKQIADNMDAYMQERFGNKTAEK